MKFAHFAGLSWELSIDHSHSRIRQTFEFGKSIGTAGKSIVNFAQLSRLVQNIVKCGKHSPINFTNFVYFSTMWECGDAFSRVIQKYTKFADFTLLYFQQFTIFCN